MLAFHASSFFAVYYRMESSGGKSGKWKIAHEFVLHIEKIANGGSWKIPWCLRQSIARTLHKTANSYYFKFILEK